MMIKKNRPCQMLLFLSLSLSLSMTDAFHRGCAIRFCAHWRGHAPRCKKRRHPSLPWMSLLVLSTVALDPPSTTRGSNTYVWRAVRGIIPEVRARGQVLFERSSVPCLDAGRVNVKSETTKTPTYGDLTTRRLDGGDLTTWRLGDLTT